MTLQKTLLMLSASAMLGAPVTDIVLAQPMAGPPPGGPPSRRRWRTPSRCARGRSWGSGRSSGRWPFSTSRRRRARWSRSSRRTSRSPGRGPSSSARRSRRWRPFLGQSRQRLRSLRDLCLRPLQLWRRPVRLSLRLWVVAISLLAPWRLCVWQQLRVERLRLHLQVQLPAGAYRRVWVCSEE